MTDKVKCFNCKRIMENSDLQIENNYRCDNCGAYTTVTFVNQPLNDNKEIYALRTELRELCERKKEIVKRLRHIECERYKVPVTIYADGKPIIESYTIMESINIPADWIYIPQKNSNIEVIK
ncbi:MAG: hypothetical protein WC748_09780 [Legionellales bacterium]|jgi:hypothetical protein